MIRLYMIAAFAMLGWCQLSQAQTDPVFSYTTNGDCFEGSLAWPQQVVEDGRAWVQFRYYSYQTGELTTDQPVASDLLESPVGVCGMGLWSYQVRFGSDMVGWTDWDEYIVIKVSENVIPGMPLLFTMISGG